MGLFGSAGVKVGEISDDLYKFGNDFWPIYVKEVRAPKVSDSGKFGMYVTCEIAHDKYAKVKPFGRWIQLPTPEEIQKQFGVVFDWENDPQDAKVVGFLIKWLMSLGFSMDEIAADIPDPLVTDPNDGRRIQGRFFLARLSAREDENGYDKINWRNPKAIPTDGSLEGLNEFTPQTGPKKQADEPPFGSPKDAIAAALAAEVADA